MPCCDGNNPKSNCNAQPKPGPTPRCSSEKRSRPDCRRPETCGGASCSDCVVVDVGGTPTQGGSSGGSSDESGGGEDDDDGDGDASCNCSSLRERSCCALASQPLKDITSTSRGLCEEAQPVVSCGSTLEEVPCCSSTPSGQACQEAQSVLPCTNVSKKFSCCSPTPTVSCNKNNEKIGAGEKVLISVSVEGLPEEIPDSWSKLRLKVSGLTCTSCEKTLLSAIHEYAYARPIAVSLFNNTADLVYDSAATTVDNIIQYLTKKTGFDCQVEHVASANTVRFVLQSPKDAEALLILEGQPGIVHCIVEETNGISKQRLLVVEFDADITGPRTIRDHLINAGVDVTVLKSNDVNGGVGSSEIQFWLLRLIISIVLCIPIAIFVYAIPEASANVQVVNSLRLWTLIVAFLASAIQIYAAAPIHQAAWMTLFRSKKVEMDMLVSLSTSVAYMYSVAAMIVLMTRQDSHLETFFETASLLVTLVILGRYATVLARGKASNAIEALRRMQPNTALLAKRDVEGELTLEEGEEVEVELLQREDVVFVRPSSRIPADGNVIKGESEVDESMITGESLPVVKQIGSQVLGGSVNSDGVLLVRITHVPTEGVLSGITRMVEEAQASRAPAQALADRIASVFTPAVIIIAGIVFFVWLGVGTTGLIVGKNPAPIEALLYAIAVLVVSCPCAVGLAVPTVIVVAAGVSARRGVLFKNGASIESAASIDVVVFDKTGTLTTGEFKVMEETYEDDRPLKELQTAVLAVANTSEHVLARAIADHLRDKCHQEIPTVSEFSSSPGLGVQGRVNGSLIRVGRPSWASDETQSPELQPAILQNQEGGRSVVAASVGGKLVAVYGLSDSLRTDAKLAVNSLVSSGIHVHVLSGDNMESVQRLSREIGISASNSIGGCLPGDKLEQIKLLQDAGHRVAFVGDGSNDAPALAQAHVGIAFGTGTDLALSTAEVVLVQPRVMSVADMLLVAKRARRTIIANFSWAFIYNVAAILLAAGAFVPLGGIRIPPALAGLGELVSVLPVIAFSMFLRRVRWATPK